MPGARGKVKLTKTLISECAPLRSEYAVWDTACEGLLVRIFPTGTKSFAVFARRFWIKLDEGRGSQHRQFIKIFAKTDSLETAKSRLVLMMQPNDRHEATLPFTYDGYRRLRRPFQTVM